MCVCVCVCDVDVWCRCGQMYNGKGEEEMCGTSSVLPYICCYHSNPKFQTRDPTFRLWKSIQNLMQ